VRQVTWDVSTESGMAFFQNAVGQMRLAGKRPKVQLVPEKRSIDQNSMFYALYQQIAVQAGDQSVNDVRRECKLRYGVPILRVSDAEFKALYDRCIKDSLTYEEKLEAMDILPVTRRMSKEQGTDYIDTILREYSKQGYSLINPNEQESMLRAVR
jgi:hypothetical protein